LKDLVVNLPAVENPEDPDFGPYDLVHSAIVPHAELPVSLQSPLQRLSVLLRSQPEANFQRASDPALEVSRDMRQIFLCNFGMV
jgi:hypothetical protein